MLRNHSQLILQVLADGAKSIFDLAQIIGTDEHAVKCACWRLFKAGRVQRNKSRRLTARCGYRSVYIYRLPD